MTNWLKMCHVDIFITQNQFPAGLRLFRGTTVAMTFNYYLLETLPSLNCFACGRLIMASSCFIELLKQRGFQAVQSILLFGSK